MEKLSQGLKWLGRKSGILLRIFGLSLIYGIPDLVLEVSKSPLSFVISGLIAIGLVIFFWRWAEKNAIKIWDRRFLTWKGLCLVVLTFSVAQLFKVFGHYVMDLQGIEDTANQLTLNKTLESIPFWLAFINMACLAAISEEVIIRGCLFNNLFEKYKILGIVVTGLIFAALHTPTNLGSWIVYASPGFLLGYLYYKTDYLIYPIAVHFINNAWSVLAFYYFQ